MEKSSASLFRICPDGPGTSCGLNKPITFSLWLLPTFLFFIVSTDNYLSSLCWKRNSSSPWTMYTLKGYQKSTNCRHIIVYHYSLHHWVRRTGCPPNVSLYRVTVKSWLPASLGHSQSLRSSTLLLRAFSSCGPRGFKPVKTSHLAPPTIPLLQPDSSTVVPFIW